MFVFLCLYTNAQPHLINLHAAALHSILCNILSTLKKPVLICFSGSKLMHVSFDTAKLCLFLTEKIESTYKEGVLSTLEKIVPELS